MLTCPLLQTKITVNPDVVLQYCDAILQLKHSTDMNNCNRRPPAVNDPSTMTTTHPATTDQIPQLTKEPIRCSRQIQQQKEQC